MHFCGFILYKNNPVDYLTFDFKIFTLNFVKMWSIFTIQETRLKVKRKKV